MYEYLKNLNDLTELFRSEFGENFANFYKHCCERTKQLWCCCWWWFYWQVCADAETGDNDDELHRQMGRPVSYGDVVQVG